MASNGFLNAGSGISTKMPHLHPPFSLLAMAAGPWAILTNLTMPISRKKAVFKM
jgi:hypothetical protein